MADAELVWDTLTEMAAEQRLVPARMLAERLQLPQRQVMRALDEHINDGRVEVLPGIQPGGPDDVVLRLTPRSNRPRGGRHA